MRAGSGTSRNVLSLSRSLGGVVRTRTARPTRSGVFARLRMRSPSLTSYLGTMSEGCRRALFSVGWNTPQLTLLTFSTPHSSSRAGRDSHRGLLPASILSRHLPIAATSQHAGTVPEAGHVRPLRVPPGQAAGQQLVEQGVAEALRGGDDLLGALDRLVDAVEDGGDGALFGEGWEQDGHGPPQSRARPLGRWCPRSFSRAQGVSPRCSSTARGGQFRLSRRDSETPGSSPQEWC